jgi:hypothetical protein
LNRHRAPSDTDREIQMLLAKAVREVESAMRIAQGSRFLSHEKRRVARDLTGAVAALQSVRHMGRSRDPDLKSESDRNKEHRAKLAQERLLQRAAMKESSDA